MGITSLFSMNVKIISYFCCFLERISYFESVEQRDKLYPDESDPNEAPIPEELVPMMQELGKYILSFEDDYTDYVIQ